jgi:arylsulfatase A-like enzyme
VNTLLVTVDALRADHTRRHGYDRDTFPVLDRLAGSGTGFDAAFANGTNTGISMPSLLTSRYRGDAAGGSGPTVATALPEPVAAGLIHSNTYFATRVPSPAGFDTVDDFGVGGGTTDDGTVGGDGTLSAGHRAFRRTVEAVKPAVETLGVADAAQRLQEAVVPARLIHEASVYASAERTTDRALDWIGGAEEPFFLWVHYMDPHRPYGIDFDDPAYGPPADRDTIHDLMATAGIRPDRIGSDDRRRIVDLYDSDLRYTSAHVDRLFDGLRDRGLWTDTNVLLTADHGEEFGDHGRYFHRNRPYDELIHVPLAVKRAETAAADGPAVDAVEGQRELLDVAPTVCRLHGVAPPDAFLGTDLFAGDSRRVIATGSFDADAPAAGARWDGRKYVTVGDDEELYDLDDDPAEQTNRAASRPDVCREYRRRIPDRLLDSADAGVPEGVDDDVAERLADHGDRD